MQKTQKRKQKPDYALIDNNVILSDDTKLSLNTYQTDRNLNVCIVGGAGTGKTRSYLLPNLLQANTSFVITDPKGEILRNSGTFLARMGYEIKIFNLIDMRNSSNYNPFAYVYDTDGELDYNAVKKMINVLVSNVVSKDSSKSGGDPFWDIQAEKLITAVSILLLEEGKPEQQNFYTVAEKIRLIELPKDSKDKNFKSELDKEFEALAEKRPDSLAVSLYREFKQGNPKAMLSIIQVANGKVQNFNFPNVRNLTFTDTLQLEQIGDRKTAVFIIVSASDKSFNFLAAMMYTQMFDLLFDRANFVYGGRLPVHVRFLLDEFANIGQIPDFDDKISVMRSMGLSVNVIIQAVSQLKKLYEKSWEIILANCDTLIFLGGQEETTLKLISEKLGKETIDVISQNRSKGKSSSTSTNNSIMGRELLTPDEVGRMDNKYSICFVRGYNPFYSLKFILDKHPNYKYTALADKQYTYDFKNVKTLIMPRPEPTPKPAKETKPPETPVTFESKYDVTDMTETLNFINTTNAADTAVSAVVAFKPQSAESIDILSVEGGLIGSDIFSLNINRENETDDTANLY